MKLYIDENNKVVTMHEATSDMKCLKIGNPILLME